MNRIIQLKANPKLADANFTSIAQRVSLGGLDFSSATPVKSFGYRFIIPVPDLGDENIDYEIQTESGASKNVRGYAFENLIDAAMQVVKGDGTGVIKIAINPLCGDLQDISQKILKKIAELGGVENLRPANLDKLLLFIHEELGQGDTYNSSDKSIKSQMHAVNPVASDSPRPLGLFKNIEELGALALFVSGPCIVSDGPHAGIANYPDGFIAVRIPPTASHQYISFKSVAPVAIPYCYTLPDGTLISDPDEQLRSIKLA